MKHIEIEKKYIVPNNFVFNKVLHTLKNLKNYKILENKEIMQVDYYYDTKNKILYNTNRLLRIRHKNSKYLMTIKTPLLDNDNKNQRREYELTIVKNDIELYKDFIFKYLPDIKKFWDQIGESLTVLNNRKTTRLFNDSVEFEVAFDNVKYKNHNKDCHEYQIEIELKSGCSNIVKLKSLSNYLESSVPELKLTNESKYERGLYLINQIK